MLGHQVGDIIVPPDHRAAHDLGMARYMLTGDAKMIGRRVEVEAMRRDGTVFPAELAMSEVRLPHRRLFTAYLRDLTAVRKAERRSSGSAMPCTRSRKWPPSARCSPASRTSSTTRSRSSSATR